MNFIGVTKKYDFARGNLMPGVLLMALPLIGIAILNAIPTLIETSVFGRYGAIALAGNAAANTVLLSVTAFSSALMVAANVVVARSCGKDEPGRVSASVNTAIIVSLVLGVLLAGSAFLLGRSVLVRLYSSAHDIIHVSRRLIDISIPRVLFGTVYCGLIGSMYGMGDTLRPLLITVVKTVVRILLTIVFTVVLRTGYVWLPVVGAVSELTGVVLALICFICGNGDARLNFSAGFHGKSLAFLVVITITAGLGTLGMNASDAIFNVMVGGFGVSAISAYTISDNVLGLVRAFPTMLVPVILTVVSQCSGADDAIKAFKNALITVLIAIVPAIFFSIVMLVFGPVIGRIYMSYDDYYIMDMMSVFVRVMVFGEFFYAAAIALAAAIRARGATVLSAMASALPALCTSALMIALQEEYWWSYEFIVGFGGFAVGFALFIGCAVTFIIVNVIAIALSKPKPAPVYGYTPAQQPVRPGMNFDPVTGRPLNQPVAPKMNFDPMTGEPLNGNKDAE